MTGLTQLAGHDTCADMREIELAREDREALRNACEQAIERTERIIEDFEPADHVKHTILSQRGFIPFAIGFGIVVGIFSYVIWTLIIGWLDLDRFVSDLGVPDWAAYNIPVIFAVWSSAGGTAMGLVNEAREARLRLATQHENAHARAMVLHSVVEELSDALPGAIPDMDDYSHSFDDDRPSPLIERALGRRGPPIERRSYGRAEPPIRSH